VVLFDNRMCGDRSNGTPGKWVLALAQAEINPAGVDAIVMTRAHIDHCGHCHPDGSLSSLNTQYFVGPEQPTTC
jgi:predicted metal-dependent RNase